VSQTRTNTTTTSLNGTQPVTQAEVEVVPKAKRRNFPAEYKLRILQEAERCSEPGQIGSLLRQEGLYSSHLSKWRQQREQGQLFTLHSRRRGRPAQQDAKDQEIARLSAENGRLSNQLEQAKLIITAQKNLHKLWSRR
jgi:transposase